jgi:hypothetical protein
MRQSRVRAEHLIRLRRGSDCPAEPHEEVREHCTVTAAVRWLSVTATSV